nr:hypothetical protein [uncultured Devosia sp.]
MQISDTECMLMMQNGQDRRYASQQITLANNEIRRLRSLLAQSQAELADERKARIFAEYQLNKRH